MLYGDWDRLPEQPVRAASGIDFIAFTDDPAATAPDWQCRKLPQRLPGDPVRSSRYAKFHPHLLLPDYDESLYIDCTVRLRQPPEALFAALLEGQAAPMACLAHSHRDCVLDEVRAVLALGYDDPQLCRQQMAQYARAGWRGAVPLAWSGLLMRRHHDPRLIAAMELWWEQVLRFSRRDQLSFAYVAERTGLDFTAHPLDNEDSPFHQWPVPRDRRRAPWQVPAAISPDGDDFAARLAAVIAEIAQDGGALTKARTEAAQWQAAFEAMRASTAWRLTGPLRAAVGWWRGG